jgi:hypothetical protein
MKAMLSSSNPEKRTLLVSILIFSGTENVNQLIAPIGGFLTDFCLARDFRCTIAIRKNNPAIDTQALEAVLHRLNRVYLQLNFVLVSDGPNLGFGKGHNENFRKFPSDFVLILNDDLGFPHLDWLGSAIEKFDGAPNLAQLADPSNPRLINPFFANGMFPDKARNHPLHYAEASVLLMRGAAFDAVGMFDERIEWAMGEDADLSLRMQQQGYAIDWLPMPHQHWRSTSFNSLPSYAKMSVKEHNRARLFARWDHALAIGSVGRKEVFDLHSDGLGDIFCALLHVRAEIERLPPAMRTSIVVNTNQPLLAQLVLPVGVEITTKADLATLEDSFRVEGVSSIRTIRSVNYALPFNIHALVAGSLSVPMASTETVLAVAAILRELPQSALAPKGPYGVVHLEFAREGHDGRGPSANLIKAILKTAAEVFDTLVLVGRDASIPVSDFGLGAKIVDLQGKLSLSELLSLIANASQFVGIDSFPSHVAQVAGVPSSLFFGSVNPLARVINERRTWPIVASLDCLGCYHSHLEPSAPFCMRRDNACTIDIPAHGIANVLQLLKQDLPFDWSRLRKLFHEQQAKFIHFMKFHPAPPARLFKQSAPNEEVSNMLYQVLEKASDLFESQRSNAVVDGLKEQIDRLRSELFEKRTLLEALRNRIPAEKSASANKLQGVDIQDLIVDSTECTRRLDGDTLVWACYSNDPRFELRPVTVAQEELCLSLVASADRHCTLKVYWRSDTEGYSEERSQSWVLGPDPKSCVWWHGEASRKDVYLRIDPSDVPCTVRLKGELLGDFCTPGAERRSGQSLIAWVKNALKVVQ